ncbi:hypothetical protein BGM26_12650 [Bacillus sp. FJAT-29790]|uniref:hypothetical protein n=1 Tax=Bacillus sp. FJAT-29790 TaxID=1895002 RepID=UPI001C241E1A|nr:hypothetical protein [Bacillus sp. FJAT-29790]MBU8879839.1 hypothetical protein [Bacillus sp. FJAT-29790]
MPHLSDKKLLEKMKEFPDHELTSEQRNKIILNIRNHKVKERKFSFNWQKIGILGALLAIFILVPVLLIDSIGSDKDLRFGTNVEIGESGVYFALIDEKGNPHHADSNFGIPNKVSLLSPPEWIADDYRSVSKIMVYIWGDEEKLLYKDMKIEAVHIDSGLTQELAFLKLSGGIYGSDAHAVTSFPVFSKPGIWKLQFFLEDEPYAEFSIGVKEPYVKVGNSTILISQEDLLAGVYEDVSLEVEGADLPEKLKLELFRLEDGTKATFIFKDKTDYIKADNGQNISMYSGDLTLKKSGKYRMTILNQSSSIEVRKDDKK